ncbi:hypothetical protein Pta02_77530 [Planobispora takensis]|uniref:Uncharacterized protein n=1 Tax=Planobispora takensis TaxID=1367882 RepID=A0A8J3T7L9_9ACTN|nr:hypothetical protein Pta02_77530 [Planobispora takensis]
MRERKKEGEANVQAAPAPPQEDTLVGLGTKIRATTRKRLRRYSVDAEIEIQEIVEDAISTYLESRGY